MTTTDRPRAFMETAWPGAGVGPKGRGNPAIDLLGVALIRADAVVLSRGHTGSGIGPRAIPLN